MRVERQAPTLALPLSQRTLAAHAARVSVPTYDRGRLTPAVVHIGVGGFHRAHQGVYFDALARRGVSSEWGVIGVGLRRADMRDALRPQDGLYTVLQRGWQGDEARVVGVMRHCLYAPEEPEAVLRALCDPRTRLVTLTVTGCAYHVDPATLRFDADHAEVAADLAAPQRPTTFFGYLVEALRRRRRDGTPPFTVLSCDNVPRNGRVTRAAVVAYAELLDAGLARWIDEQVAFPSSVVDRITPQTTPRVRRLLRREFGIHDRWPVVTERFTQWIVEDDFCNGRPPLEEVGVQFVADVAPYELVKKRLLNGGHSALAYLAYLAGHRSTDAAMGDPIFSTFAERLMEREILPLLPVVPGMELGAYRRTLLRRFANPRVADQLARLCGRGSTKMPAYLLPSLSEALDGDLPHELLTAAVAGWFRYLRGVDDAGAAIDIADAHKDRLHRLALAGGDDPRPLLRERAVFGNLVDDDAFVSSLALTLRRMSAGGTRAALGASLVPGYALAA